MHRGLRTRIIERPGSTLHPAGVDALLTQARGVAASLGGSPLDYGPLSGRKEWLDRAVVTVVEDVATSRAVGISAMVILDCALRGRSVPVMHVGLTIVSPGYRNRGVCWRLTGFTIAILLLRNRLRPFWVSNVSQVPSAIGMFCEAMSNVYPWPTSNSPAPYDHLTLARQLMTRYRAAFGVGDDARFDSRRFVIENAYTGGSDSLKKTFGQAPRHRSEHFNDACARELNYERGDDFLQIGRMSVGAGLRIAFRALRASFAAAASVPVRLTPQGESLR